MRHARLALAVLAASSASALAGPTTAPARDGWTLVWHDEFDAAALDPTRWACDTGNGFPAGDQWISGWGNDELQFYTARPENVAVRDGMLRLRAIRQLWEQCGFTSGKVTSRGRFAQRYGRFEFRARLPVGQGLWSALWLLPAEPVAYGTWAASGEIDVMEARGQAPTKTVGTIHYGGRWPNNAHASVDYTLPGGGRIDAFHVYAVEWEPGVIRWSVDGQQSGEQRRWHALRPDAKPPTKGEPPAAGDVHPFPAPFDRPFYVLMNLAVGGRFLGNPDDATPFPAEMAVDYVRVYERATPAAP